MFSFSVLTLLVSLVVGLQSPVFGVSKRDNVTLAELEEEILKDAETASTCDDCQASQGRGSKAECGFRTDMFAGNDEIDPDGGRDGR